MKDEIFAKLKKSVLFETLDESQLLQLAQLCHIQPYQKGEFIFEEGNLAEAFFLNAEGQVKIVKYSGNGKEQVLHHFGPDEPLGEVAVFLGRTFPASCISITEGQLLKIRRSDFVDLIKRQPQMALDLLAVMAERLHRFNQMIGDLTLVDAPIRLARFLQQQLPLPSTPNYEFNLPNTKAELAKVLSITPETLSRAFAKLKEQGIIAVKGRRIRIIDPKRLTEMVE